MALSRAERFAEVDLLKAVAILVVVLIHTVRSPWETDASATELWIGQVTRFAVPCFLFASGFLYATPEPVPPRVTGNRLLRVVVPYLLFTAVAQLQRAVDGRGLQTGSVIGDWGFAGSFGPYYYVFVAAVFVVLTPALARIPGRLLPGLLVFEIGVQLYLELHSGLDFFWHLRNPLLWLAYFHLGWALRLWREEVVDFASRHRFMLLAASGGAFLALALAVGSPPHLRVQRAFAWASIYPALAFLLIASIGRSVAPLWPRGVRVLSDASYTLYLVHLFFLYPLRKAFDPPFRVFDVVAIAAPWLLAIAVSLVFVIVGRTLLGGRSRTWIGA